MLITFDLWATKLLFSSESLGQAESNEVQHFKIARFSIFCYFQLFNCGLLNPCRVRQYQTCQVLPYGLCNIAFLCWTWHADLMSMPNCQNLDSTWHKNANKVNSQSFSIYSYKNVYNSKIKWDIFTKFDTYLWAHSDTTQFGAIVSIGGALIEQNMKLPLTAIEYYATFFYIFFECIGVTLRNFISTIETMTWKYSKRFETVPLVVKSHNGFSNKC